MRVLVTSPIFPPDLGGPAVYVPHFARFMVDRGHHVDVIAFCSDPDPQGYPFGVQTIARGPLPVRYLKAFWRVFRAAKNYDVVYVQEHLALLHVLAAKLRRKPSVIRIMVDGAWEISHRKGWIGDDDIVTFQGKEYGWKVRLVRRLQKRWWGWVHRLISCSEFLRQIPIQRYGVAPDKIVRIFNGYHGPKAADLAETPAEARAAVGLPEGPRYLLTICRLMVWKGVDGILHALKQLPEDVHLVIAGDGDMETAWKELSYELELENRVHFLGNVPYAQIPYWIRAAEIFVLNSEYEGLSHTLLEVSALGTPIVCTGVCGNPEVVEDGVNGFLVPPRSPEALAEALSKLLYDRELQQAFRAAGLAGLGRFDPVARFEAVEAVLEEAAASRP